MNQQDERTRPALQGAEFQPANEQELRDALEQAFDYRGDVTLTRRDGTRVDGYIYERTPAKPLADSFLRVIPADRNVKLTIPYADIAAVAFSGRDAAAGKSWEAWVKKYREKKAAGETNIELRPESLD